MCLSVCLCLCVCVCVCVTYFVVQLDQTLSVKQHISSQRARACVYVYVRACVRACARARALCVCAVFVRACVRVLLSQVRPINKWRAHK